MILIYDGTNGDWSKRLVKDYGKHYNLDYDKMLLEISEDRDNEYEIIQYYTDSILDSDIPFVSNNIEYSWFWDSGDLFLYDISKENPWEEKFDAMDVAARS